VHINRVFICAIIWSVLGIATLQASEHVLDEHIAAEFGMEFAQNYLQASQVYDEMWALFPRSSDGALLYPVYYGGHFFSEKGNLVFNVVDGHLAEAETGIFAELLKRDCVEVREVRFSYQALLLIVDDICCFVANNPDDAREVITWRIDAPGNMVVVGISGYNEEKEAVFKRNVMDSPMVKLEAGRAVEPIIPRVNKNASTPDSALQLQPGVRIYIDELGFSAGFPAARGQQAGFVTALHGLPLEGQAVRLGSVSGAEVGNVTAPIRFSGSADGAFISLHQADFSRTVDGRTLTHSNIRPSQGMILVSVSTPPDGTMRIQRNIVVTNAHFNANMGGGLVLTDMIQTTGHALYGESGGLVFRPVGNSAQVQGVIVGSDVASVTGDNMFFAWSEAVNHAIGVVQE